MVNKKNRLYAVLIVQRIKTYLIKKGLNINSGRNLYLILKRDFGQLAYEDFLQEIANTKDVNVYAEYFYDTLDLDLFDFSSYVAKTHDAQYCMLFYGIDGVNKEVLFDEIVTSCNGKVCLEFLMEHKIELNDEQKMRLKNAIIDCSDVNVLRKCLDMKEEFNSDELDMIEFAFKSIATPRRRKEFESKQMQECERIM